MPEKKKNDLKIGDISGEKSRVYKIYIDGLGLLHEIYIEHPQTVFYGPTHCFHRVFDGVKTFLCPAPGLLYYHGDIVGFVVIEWESKDRENPCQW